MARRERRDTSAASGVLGSTRRPRMRSILLPESEKLCEVWEDTLSVSSSESSLASERKFWGMNAWRRLGVNHGGEKIHARRASGGLRLRFFLHHWNTTLLGMLRRFVVTIRGIIAPRMPSKRIRTPSASSPRRIRVVVVLLSAAIVVLTTDHYYKRDTNSEGMSSISFSWISKSSSLSSLRIFCLLGTLCGSDTDKHHVPAYNPFSCPFRGMPDTESYGVRRNTHESLLRTGVCPFNLLLRHSKALWMNLVVIRALGALAGEYQSITLLATDTDVCEVLLHCLGRSVDGRSTHPWFNEAKFENSQHQPFRPVLRSLSFLALRQVRPRYRRIHCSTHPSDVFQQTTQKKLPILYACLVLASRSLRTLLEIVLETTSHGLEVAHTTRSLTSATRTLQRPVVYARLQPSLPNDLNTHLQCLILASG